MIKIAIPLAAAATAALAFPSAALAAPQVDIKATGPVIELNVYESVAGAPDIVTIGAGVSTSAPSAVDAMRQNAAAMTKVIARIKALGIPDKDIQTTGIALSAQYDYQDSGPVFRGYQAANRVSVILRKVDDTGPLLDALVEAGATDISGPEFGIENDNSAREEARKRAVTRGEAQARAYAKMLGYEGVRVLAVSESIEGGFPMFEATKSVALAVDAAVPTPVQPGQVATGVSVTITYELTGTGTSPAK